MRRFLVRFTEPVRSGRAPSWADFITTTAELKFSLHTRGGGCALLFFGLQLHRGLLLRSRPRGPKCRRRFARQSGSRPGLRR
jgi:hypothetical protein